MTGSKSEQQALIAKVDGIITKGTGYDTEKKTLAALGFEEKADHGMVVTLENKAAEIFIHLALDEKRSVVDHRILTFDEIKGI